MRIGYLVLNHRPPAQLIRLLGTIRRQQPDARFVVHNDSLRTSLEPGELSGIGDVQLITSRAPLLWGDFSIVEACWRGLARLYEQSDLDWSVLLSAQDYPIRPLDELERLLTESTSDAFLECALAAERPAEQRRILEYRYRYKYLTPRPKGSQQSGSATGLARRAAGVLADVVNHLQPYVHVYKYPLPLPNRWGFRAARTPFSDSFPCWHASMWMALSRRAAGTLLERVHDNPGYVEYYRHTAVPDESATATILCNEPELKVEPQGLHFTRWTDPHSGHPDVLRSSDLPAMLGSGCFFARKFDPSVDAGVLDEIDAVLEGGAAGRSPPT